MDEDQSEKGMGWERDEDGATGSDKCCPEAREKQRELVTRRKRSG